MSEEPGGHDASFEERLAAARGRQGLEPTQPGAGKPPDGLDGSALAIGLRVGVEMVSALVVAVAIGWGLDRLFGTKPILLAVFVLLGGAAGVLNVWRCSRRGTTRQRQDNRARASARERQGTLEWRPDQVE